MADRLSSDVRFAVVPEWVLDLDVSDRAVRLYGLLARYADRKGEAFPARRTLAGRLRCAVRSVDRALAELVDAGAVTVTHRYVAGRQTSSTYRLTAVRGATPQARGGDTGDAPGGDTGDAQNENQRNENHPNLAPAPRTRQRDVLFERLAAVGGHRLEALTRAERSRLNAATKQLRDAGATPEDVDAAVRAWARRYPNATVTAMALVNHWSELQAGGPARPTVGPNGRTTCDVCLAPWAAHDPELCAILRGEDDL